MSTNLKAVEVIGIDEVSNNGASDYVHGGNIDSPAEGFVGDSYGLTIEGWVLSRRIQIEHVEVLHEERPVAIVPVDLERPDIAAGFPEVEGASRSGFRASISTLKLADRFELVLRAKQHLRERGRARVLRKHAVGVEGAHQRDVVGERRRQVVARPEQADAALVFTVLLGVAAEQRIAAGAGVGVDEAIALVLRAEMAQHQHQDQVLEHVGVVAGMKGVAVGEHGECVARR